MEKIKNKRGDLTIGAPGKVILTFAIPMLIGVVFQQLYNIADSIIVGQFVSMDAFAAISASYPVNTLFLGIATGGSAGVTIFVSYYFGSKKFDEMMTALRTSIIAFLGFALILLTIGLVFDDLILNLLSTPTELLHDAKIYLDIFLISLPFVFLYNVVNGCFQALGDSMTPLILLAASSVMNVVLDLWWVAVFHWGIAGAALATMVSQLLAAVIAAVLLWKRVAEYRGYGSWFKKESLIELIGYAVPGMLQQSMVSVGQLFMQNRINSLGTEIVAGHAAAFKVNTIVLAAVHAFGNSLSAYVSQNFGAKKYERILKGYRVTVGAILVMCIIVFAFCTGAGNLFVGAFLEAPINQNALSTGVYFLKIVSPCYIMLTFIISTNCLLKGLGNMTAFTVDTIVDMGVRVATAFLLINTMGYTAICVAYPMGWIAGLIVVLIYYYLEKKKRPELK